MCEVAAKRPKLTSITKEPCDFESSCTESDQDVLTNQEVGILGYVQPSVPGFDCVLKNRWEDFIVQEIVDGVCAELTDCSPILNITAQPEDLNHTAILSPYMDDLNKLDSGVIKHLEIKAPVNKSERTSIHKSVRALFPSMMTSTVTKTNESVIVVTKSDPKEVNRHDRTPRTVALNMPKDSPYCRFVLYKEGKDTMHVIQVLSRYLHINPGAFTYAGTKDRRAITTQFVTVKYINSKTLSDLNSRLQGIRLGNFSYVSKPLFLGDLDGNRFTVVLRGIRVPESEVRKALQSWENHGFVNYYGLQRFGHSSSSRSFDIGKHLILGEWTQAIDLILKPTAADLPVLREVKERFANGGDAAQCALDAPVSLEKTLLQGIAKSGKTLNAIQTLPRNLRQLYVHSYQSLIWNRVASHRIHNQDPSNSNAQPGDLFVASFESDETGQTESDLGPNKVAVCEVKDPNLENSSSMPQVATENNYLDVPLTQIVLPLPGYEIQYPTNQSGDMYKQYMAEDGIQLNDLDNRVKDFALPGSYRCLVVKPTNVEFEFRHYTDPTIPLVTTDLKRLSNTNCNPTNPVQQHDDTHREQKTALILRFNLPKSSYATVALRELTKTLLEKR